MNCPTSRTRTDEGSYRYRPARTAHRQGFLQELSGKGIAAILWQNDSGVIYGVTYIDHNSKTVFKGSLLGKNIRHRL